MAIAEFKLPDVGEGVAEGKLVTWFVEPGDHVEKDQPIAEVETDKALVEIPSSYEGVVAELRAKEDETVPVGDVLVAFEVDDGTVAEGSSSAETASGNSSVSTETSSADSDPTGDSAKSASETSGGTDVPVQDERVFAPPSVRNLAREQGVDLSAVRRRMDGSAGRISESDVRAFTNSNEAVGTESTAGAKLTAGTKPTASTQAEGEFEAHETGREEHDSTPSERVESADRDRTLAMPATRQLAREKDVAIDRVPASEQRDGEPFVTPDDVDEYVEADRTTSGKQESRAVESDHDRPGDRIPYTGVRRTIGEKMSTSKYTAPHVSHQDEVDVSELVEMRSRLKEVASDRDASLTYLPFAIKASVAALKEVPALNAELDEENDEILLHDEYNIGIAVANDAGLMVPVIDDADQKSLIELAREIDDKAERARTRSIAPDEMQGGTFTITNVGAIGGEYVSPIINYPEAGILAMGSLKERPWVEDGELVVRETLPISMSVDHRIVDGAEAAQFTNEVKRYLNNPELLLLD
ncbi:dihydrolipoamide acetyltransferase family protein [Halostagnicola bangensis]